MKSGTGMNGRVGDAMTVASALVMAGLLAFAWSFLTFLVLGAKEGPTAAMAILISGIVSALAWTVLGPVSGILTSRRRRGQGFAARRVTMCVFLVAAASLAALAAFQATPRGSR